jgi:hypothetical protein
MLSNIIFAKKQESKNIKTIELDTIEFHPKIHKPELLSTLSHKKLKIKNLKRDKDLIPDIINSVNEKPF